MAIDRRAGSPRHRHRIRGHGYFKRLGPGIVTGAADDDPSGIGTYSQVGAAYGYGLVWSIPAVAPLAAAVQESAARLGLVTGCGLSTLIRKRFPQVLLVVSYVAVMMTLEITLPYHRYARVLRWLALSLLAYVFVLASVDVSWSAVVDSLVSPSIVGGAGGIAALIAVFGTTVSPYLFFWQASEEVEEEVEQETDHEHREPVDVDHVRAMRIDVIGGMVSAVAIAFAIVVVAAATLHPHGITNIDTPTQAAKALRPLVGNAAGFVFALGIVGLGLLAVPVLAGANAYALSEAFDWHEGLSRRLSDARGFYAVVAGSMLTGMVVGFAGVDPIHALYLAAIGNGLAAPPLLALLLVLTRDRALLGDFRSHALSITVVGLALMISVALPVAYLLVR